MRAELKIFMSCFMPKCDSVHVASAEVRDQVLRLGSHQFPDRLGKCG